MFCGTDGVFRAGNFWNDRTAVTLNANRSSEPLVRSMKQLAASPPNYSVKIGGRPCWSVHSASEISEAVWLAGQGVEAAQEQADIALAQANQANARLASIANDDVLDRTEKYDLITEYNRILDEIGEIDAKAEYFQITTERDAYNGAVAALVSYLTALSPAYNNTASDTPINGGEFRAKFAAVYSTRQTLLNKLVEAAGQTATWSYIDGAGKPEDNATNGATLGENITDTAGNLINPADLITAEGVAANVRDNALTVAKFATGIRPIEIVDSLPTEGNSVGRMAFLKGANKVYRYTATGWTATVEAVDLVGQITETQITDNAISTPKLAANAVTANKIAANTITADQIALNSLTAGVIAAGAIGTDQLAVNSVRAGNIAAEAVTSDKIAANSITAGKLATENLITTSAQIVDGIIGTAKIGDLAVNTLKIAGGAISANQVVTAADAYVAAGGTVDFLTTGWMTIGDGTFGSGIIDIDFTVDATVAYDAACRISLYTDTGSGYTLATQQTLGISTNNGDSYSRVGGSVSTVVSGAQVRVRASVTSGAYIPRSVVRAQYIRDVTMTLMGAKR